MNQIVDQPPPVPNDRPSIHDLVVADIESRKALGLERYSSLLQAHNGRDALVDLYQELLDACCYIRQVIEERNGVEVADSTIRPAPAGLPLLGRAWQADQDATAAALADAVDERPAPTGGDEIVVAGVAAIRRHRGFGGVADWGVAEAVIAAVTPLIVEEHYAPLGRALDEVTLDLDGGCGHFRHGDGGPCAECDADHVPPAESAVEPSEQADPNPPTPGLCAAACGAHGTPDGASVPRDRAAAVPEEAYWAAALAERTAQGYQATLDQASFDKAVDEYFRAPFLRNIIDVAAPYIVAANTTNVDGSADDPERSDATPEQITEEWLAAMVAMFTPAAASAISALHGLVGGAHDRGQQQAQRTDIRTQPIAGNRQDDAEGNTRGIEETDLDVFRTAAQAVYDAPYDEEIDYRHAETIAGIAAIRRHVAEEIAQSLKTRAAEWQSTLSSVTSVIDGASAAGYATAYRYAANIARRHAHAPTEPAPALELTADAPVGRSPHDPTACGALYRPEPDMHGFYTCQQPAGHLDLHRARNGATWT